jgi:hypothetical protein
MKNEKSDQMRTGNGKIVLMGSGELTATMVEVHKGLAGHNARESTNALLELAAGIEF